MNSPDGLNPAYADAFKNADLVLGLDLDRADLPAECWMLFYGRGALQGIAHSRKPQTLSIIVVGYRQCTSQLDALIACCQVHKGECDYERSSEVARSKV